MWLIFAALVIAALAAWIVRRPRGRARASDDVDDETLEAAEREVRDLHSMTSPDDADDQLPDWGPGAPRS
jgi:hypothetical protein